MFTSVICELIPSYNRAVSADPDYSDPQDLFYERIRPYNLVADGVVARQYNLTADANTTDLKSAQTAKFADRTYSEAHYHDVDELLSQLNTNTSAEAKFQYEYSDVAASTISKYAEDGLHMDVSEAWNDAGHDSSSTNSSDNTSIDELEVPVEQLSESQATADSNAGDAVDSALSVPYTSSDGTENDVNEAAAELASPIERSAQETVFFEVSAGPSFTGESNITDEAVNDTEADSQVASKPFNGTVSTSDLPILEHGANMTKSNVGNLLRGRPELITTSRSVSAQHQLLSSPDIAVAKALATTDANDGADRNISDEDPDFVSRSDLQESERDFC